VEIKNLEGLGTEDCGARSVAPQGPNAAFYFAFDEPLSHLIYAACDMIVVPSMFEPCGLTQMIAMRYGMLPSFVNQ
jgi:starch synthase